MHNARYTRQRYKIGGLCNDIMGLQANVTRLQRYIGKNVTTLHKLHQLHHYKHTQS